jgi:hypothetical protein
MYACLHVCMYVCMYVCMSVVCVYLCMHAAREIEPDILAGMSSSCPCSGPKPQTLKRQTLKPDILAWMSSSGLCSAPLQSASNYRNHCARGRKVGRERACERERARARARAGGERENQREAPVAIFRDPAQKCRNIGASAPWSHHAIPLQKF